MTTPSSPRPTITLDAANSYFQTRTRAEAWFQAPDATRAAALETASRILGRAYRFTSDARYVDANGADAWREEILDALCEEAYWLMRYDADANAELVARGVRRAAIAGLEASFDSALRSTMLCELARRYVGELGVLVDPDKPLGSLTSTPLAF